MISRSPNSFWDPAADSATDATTNLLVPALAPRVNRSAALSKSGDICRHLLHHVA